MTLFFVLIALNKQQNAAGRYWFVHRQSFYFLSILSFFFHSFPNIFPLSHPRQSETLLAQRCPAIMIVILFLWSFLPRWFALYSQAQANNPQRLAIHVRAHWRWHVHNICNSCNRPAAAGLLLPGLVGKRKSIVYHTSLITTSQKCVCAHTRRDWPGGET